MTCNPTGCIHMYTNLYKTHTFWFVTVSTHQGVTVIPVKPYWASMSAWEIWLRFLVTLSVLIVTITVCHVDELISTLLHLLYWQFLSFINAVFIQEHYDICMLQWYFEKEVLNIYIYIYTYICIIYILTHSILTILCFRICNLTVRKKSGLYRLFGKCLKFDSHPCFLLMLLQPLHKGHKSAAVHCSK